MKYSDKVVSSIPFILIVAGLAQVSVMASESVTVFDERATTIDDPYSVEAKFIVNHENKELGRAWVDIEVDGGYVDANLDRQEMHFQRTLPGLKFDSSKNEVIYQPNSASTPVVCGNFSDGGFFDRAHVNATGSCRLVTKIEKRRYDDGHYVRRKPYIMVDMLLTQ